MFQKFWDGDVSERLDTRAASNDLTKIVDVDARLARWGLPHVADVAVGLFFPA